MKCPVVELVDGALAAGCWLDSYTFYSMETGFLGVRSAVKRSGIGTKHISLLLPLNTTNILPSPHITLQINTTGLYSQPHHQTNLHCIHFTTTAATTHTPKPITMRVLTFVALTMLLASAKGGGGMEQKGSGRGNMLVLSDEERALMQQCTQLAPGASASSNVGTTAELTAKCQALRTKMTPGGPGKFGPGNANRTQGGKDGESGKGGKGSQEHTNGGTDSMRPDLSEEDRAFVRTCKAAAGSANDDLAEQCRQLRERQSGSSKNGSGMVRSAKKGSKDGNDGKAGTAGNQGSTSSRATAQEEAPGGQQQPPRPDKPSFGLDSNKGKKGGKGGKGGSGMSDTATFNGGSAGSEANLGDHNADRGGGSDSGGNNLGLVAGLGGVAVIGIIVAVAVVVRRQQNQHNATPTLSQLTVNNAAVGQAADYREGAVDSLPTYEAASITSTGSYRGYNNPTYATTQAKSERPSSIC